MNQQKNTFATKGDYRLVNDGCATVPYLLTLEKKILYKSGCTVWERVPDTPIYTDYREAIKALDSSTNNNDNRKRRKKTNKMI